MAIVVFILSLILLVAGAASGYQSLDLLPTGIGVLYALAGAVGVAAAVVTFAIGVAIRRIDALAKLLRQSAATATLDWIPAAEPGPSEEAPAGPAPSMSVAAEPLAPESAGEPAAAEDESPININRTGHLPSLDAIETVLETPEAAPIEKPEEPPSMIGSYTSAGANYKIFADGSIEAETSEGTFKFASMTDFKRHLVESKAKATPETE
jgi:hypothetical protein